MATTVRDSNWGGASLNSSQLLVSYISDEIRVLEPDLKYAQLGKRRDVPKGFDRLLFPQTNQLPILARSSSTGQLGAPSIIIGSVWGSDASILGGPATDARGYPISSTVGVAPITEGTNPTSVTWGATAYSSGPAQYGILVAVSDLLVRNSAIEVVDDATRQVRNALARLVDSAIQYVVNAGSNGVIYSGGKTSRSGLAAGDIITQNDVNRGVMQLRSSNAAGLEPFEGGYYAAICNPHTMYDLMTNTATGSWIDAARYTDPGDIKNGKMTGYRGVKYMETAWQNYFNSTVPVMPLTLVGKDSFGWGYFQEPTAMLVSTPDSNNPLNLYNSISGKVTLGATRFEDAIGYVRIVRVESAFTGS